MSSLNIETTAAHGTATCMPLETRHNRLLSETGCENCTPNSRHSQKPAVKNSTPNSRHSVAPSCTPKWVPSSNRMSMSAEPGQDEKISKLLAQYKEVGHAKPS